MNLEKFIRDIPDFPQKGIIFKDITTLLAEPKAFKEAINRFIDYAKRTGAKTIVGIDSRGFIFGSVIAYELGLKFIPVRKKGKLPYSTVSASYDLEYGTSTVEMHTDAIRRGEKVLIIDDLLATGGTAKATCDLVKKLGGKIVGLAFLIELRFLKGAKKLKPYNILSLIKYE